MKALQSRNKVFTVRPSFVPWFSTPMDSSYRWM